MMTLIFQAEPCRIRTWRKIRVDLLDPWWLLASGTKWRFCQYLCPDALSKSAKLSRAYLGIFCLAEWDKDIPDHRRSDQQSTKTEGHCITTQVSLLPSKMYRSKPKRCWWSNEGPRSLVEAPPPTSSSWVAVRFQHTGPSQWVPCWFSSTPLRRFVCVVEGWGEDGRLVDVESVVVVSRFVSQTEGRVCRRRMG